LQPSDGENGWDIFSLDYKVQPPLNTIFKPQTMHIYHKIFHFLWKLKHIEHLLTNSWSVQMGILHQHKKISNDLTNLLHSSQILRSEMIHFVNQFTYYINNVIECAFSAFKNSVNNDLDGLIKAHDGYLNEIWQTLSVFFSNTER
jgi:gamma-tubulin complex component 3